MPLLQPSRSSIAKEIIGWMPLFSAHIGPQSNPQGVMDTGAVCGTPAFSLRFTTTVTYSARSCLGGCAHLRPANYFTVVVRSLPAISERVGREAADSAFACLEH